MSKITPKDPTARSKLRKQMKRFFSATKLRRLRHLKIELFLTMLRRRQSLERKLYEATH